MKLATQVNEAVMGNVQGVGEFRIRNSAKAFNILSSGLYANKIRAIIRELSCNAVDSHVAAGRGNVPFEVHLPTTLEPYFAIRDFGTGLSYDQVVNIYTTYFESTKTDSNDFIGALGLGSKSPFSYTENFTVVTIKDGIKCVFTAFINENGVPSVALMGTDKECAEPNGVEVRFAVENTSDFYKFREEAAHVYRWFKLKPIVTGETNFKHTEVTYTESNIVPGVHLRDEKYHRGAVAIMGNIAYPVEIPNAEASLGQLAQLLKFPLVMEFAIGELDFQASREGLSYIPETIASVKAKLEELNKQLAVHVADKVKDIKNSWEKAFALQKLAEEGMFATAVDEYCVANKVDFYNDGKTQHRYSVRDMFKPVVVDVDEVAKKYNIVIRAFSMSSGYGGNVASELNPEKQYPNGYDQPPVVKYHVPISKNVQFVTNDTNVGALNRAKYHYRSKRMSGAVVFVLDRVSKDKTPQYEKFLKAIKSPLTVSKVSTLEQTPRKAKAANGKIGVLSLQRKDDGRRGGEYVWRDAGDVASHANETCYYVPLSGYNAVFTKFLGHGLNAYDLRDAMARCGLSGLQNVTIYGVRKAEIDAVKGLKNWVSLEDAITARLQSITTQDVVNLAGYELDGYGLVTKYNAEICKELADDNAFKVANLLFKNYNRSYDYSLNALNKLFTVSGVKFSVADATNNIRKQCEEVLKKYPLLKYLDRNTPVMQVVEYVKLVDSKA